MRYGSKSFTFVVMTNVLPSPAIEIRQQYDLKGSTYKRTVGDKNRHTPGVVLKDNDFAVMRGKLGVGAHLPKLRDMMEKDTAFLKRQNVVDYSLLVMIERTDRRAKLDHQHWVSENREALHASYDSLKSGPGASFFDQMDFEE